jgi:hypothetical protein
MPCLGVQVEAVRYLLGQPGLPAVALTRAGRPPMTSSCGGRGPFSAAVRRPPCGQVGPRRLHAISSLRFTPSHAEPTAALRLYPVVILQYSSTALYQISYHNQ